MTLNPGQVRVPWSSHLPPYTTCEVETVTYLNPVKVKCTVSVRCMVDGREPCSWEDLHQQRLYFCPAALQGLALWRLGAALLSWGTARPPGVTGLPGKSQHGEPQGPDWREGQ